MMDVKNYALWTALVTPFKKDLSVDYDSLRNLILEQQDAGNGLLILGSTGEALNIDLNTRKEIIKFVKKMDPDVPVMAGVGGHDLEETRKWVRWLETQDVDAYLMVVPIYAKPGIVGQTQWFRTLMDDVSKPVMLYNVPSRTGKSLELDAVKDLKDHDNFWGIKEASGSVEECKKYIKASGKGKVYCGDDGLMPEFSKAGVHGLVSVASNVWPKPTNLYVKQCLEDNLNEKDMWKKACDSLFTASNPVPAKRIMKTQERIEHDIVRPPLSQMDLVDDRDLVDASKKVNQWFEDQLENIKS